MYCFVISHNSIEYELILINNNIEAKLISSFYLVLSSLER